MNGCLLTLCVAHRDGLIMTDLNCFRMDVCVSEQLEKAERKRQKESDGQSDKEAVMCVHVWRVHSVCVCGHAWKLLLFIREMYAPSGSSFSL